MTAVMEAPVRPPTLTDRDEFCHYGRRGSYMLTLCGRTINEEECCGHGFPPCGREKCPECVELAEGGA